MYVDVWNVSNMVRGSRDRMAVVFTTHIQWFVEGRWFSPGTPVSSINKIDRYDITEILLKVTLNTKTPSNIATG